MTPGLEKLARRKMGRRADVIIRKGQLEVACGETAKTQTDEKGTKTIKEGSLKLPKMQKDMLLDLCKTAQEKNLHRKLSIVAFLHGGIDEH